MTALPYLEAPKPQAQTLNPRILEASLRQAMAAFLPKALCFLISTGHLGKRVRGVPSRRKPVVSIYIYIYIYICSDSNYECPQTTVPVVSVVTVGCRRTPTNKSVVGGSEPSVLGCRDHVDRLRAALTLENPQDRTAFWGVSG